MAPIRFQDERPIPCLLSNEPWKTSKTYEVKDPHSPKDVLHSVHCVNEEEAIKAVETAAKAFKSWKKSALADRQAIFRKAAALLRERSQEYAGVEQSETTSGAGMAGFEMGLAVDNLEETAAAIHYLRGETVTTAGQRAMIEYCPYGVVLGIAPWNAPLTLGLRAVTNAIMAGNTVLLKTSEFSPRVHSLIGTLFVEAGLPAGVLTILNIAPEDAPKVVETIIAHPSVQKVNFTGSTIVGTKISQVCAKYLKPCTLELGGSAPLVVLKDADLEFASNSASFGYAFHQGQICMSTNSVIAHEDIADELEASILKKLGDLEATKDGVFVRGLFSKTSADRSKSLIQDAKDKGAKIHGKENDNESNLVHPTVLTGVTPKMRIYKEENFSPLLSILRFKTDEEAIEMANATEYGLAASVYSKDEGHAYKIASEIDAGMVHINGATVHDHQTLPHGGWKKSGNGRFNGVYGLKEFSQIKVITINEPHMMPI